jgi:hypothetical protein
MNLSNLQNCPRLYRDAPLIDADNGPARFGRLEEIPDSYSMDDEDVCVMNMVQAEQSTQVYSAEQDCACFCGGSQVYLDALIYPGQTDLGPFPREGVADS